MPAYVIGLISFAAIFGGSLIGLGDAPYVIPSGIITGGLIGFFIVMWAFKTV